MPESEIVKELNTTDLGIDLDTKNQFKLLKVYFNARWLAEHINPNAEVKVYETEHGYHIRVYGVPTNVHYRAGLCDDPERLYLGEKRCGFSGVANDILFSIKRRYKGNKIVYVSEEKEIDVLSGGGSGGGFGRYSRERRRYIYRKRGKRKKVRS